MSFFPFTWVVQAWDKRETQTQAVLWPSCQAVVIRWALSLQQFPLKVTSKQEDPGFWHYDVFSQLDSSKAAKKSSWEPIWGKIYIFCKLVICRKLVCTMCELTLYTYSSPQPHFRHFMTDILIPASISVYLLGVHCKALWKKETFSWWFIKFLVTCSSLSQLISIRSPWVEDQTHSFLITCWLINESIGSLLGVGAHIFRHTDWVK